MLELLYAAVLFPTTAHDRKVKILYWPPTHSPSHRSQQYVRTPRSIQCTEPRTEGLSSKRTFHFKSGKIRASSPLILRIYGLHRILFVLHWACFKRIFEYGINSAEKMNYASIKDFTSCVFECCSINVQCFWLFDALLFVSKHVELLRTNESKTNKQHYQNPRFSESYTGHTHTVSSKFYQLTAPGQMSQFGVNKLQTVTRSQHETRMEQRQPSDTEFCFISVFLYCDKVALVENISVFVIKALATWTV